MKACIVGYGSIGKRHARLLQPLVSELSVVTSQPVEGFAVHLSLEQALAETHPDYMVLCSPTHLHGTQLAALKKASFKGTTLVEKPLVAQADEAESHYPFTTYVAYNLRFHPVIVALRSRLQTETVLNVQAYVGQHLAQWRPGREVKQTYSAHKTQGGGVLRDLSHEIDLLAHLFGPLKLQGSLVARVGDVTVDSEDSAALLLKATRCPVIGLQMNYLDPVATRQIRIVTAKHSILADLITGEISCDGKVETIGFMADDSYRAMHKALLVGEVANLCTLAEGFSTVQLIEESER